MLKKQTNPQGVIQLLSGAYTSASDPAADVYLLRGDVTQAPVEKIVPQVGVSYPTGGDVRDGFCLKIAHFNDFHGRISNLRPEGDEPVFSRMVTRIRQLQKQVAGREDQAFLLLSGGDDLNGYLFSELLGRSPAKMVMHAAYRVYNACGIHASCVGNHELDIGIPMMSHSVLREAGFPVLSANLLLPDDVENPCYPAAIVVTKGVRVGIVGLSTQAECHHFEADDYVIVDALTACRNLLPALRPMCDVVILLTHLGYSLQSRTALVEKAGDVELAQQLDPTWVDLIAGGHTHTTLNCDALQPENVVNHIPIVQAGAYAKWLGEVTLEKRGHFRVSDAHLTSLQDFAVDEEFEREIIHPILQKLEPVRHRVLGKCASHPDVLGDNLLNHFAREESALANLLTDALVERCRMNALPVDLAMIDRTSLAQGLPDKKELTFEDWYHLMPHLDNIQIYTLSGEQLLQLLQDNARRVDGWGEPVLERGFAHFSVSLRYQIDPGRSRAEARAVHILFENVILSEYKDSLFSVATNCFFRGLCHDWEQNYAPQNVLLIKDLGWPGDCTRLFLREEIVYYLLEHGGATAEAGVRRDGRLEILPAF